jgi:formyltetrahydrofolate hydrolase
MESFQTESIHVDCPIVPIEVFGNLSDRIEYSLTQLVESINQATEERAEERLHRALCLISYSNALHTLLLAHLERSIPLEICTALSNHSPNS